MEWTRGHRAKSCSDPMKKCEEYVVQSQEDGGILHDSHIHTTDVTEDVDEKVGLHVFIISLFSPPTPQPLQCLLISASSSQWCFFMSGSVGPVLLPLSALSFIVSASVSSEFIYLLGELLTTHPKPSGNESGFLIAYELINRMWIWVSFSCWQLTCNQPTCFSFFSS